MASQGNSILHSMNRKLDRARQHVDSLTSEISEYVDSFLEARRIVENSGMDHVLIWERFAPPPESFGMIIGDAVHNIRSALDHLTVALAKKGATESGASVSLAEEHDLQFLICTKGSDFRKNKARCLRHVSAADIAFIRGMQPFAVLPRNPERHILSRISDLDNADKHREINTPIMLRRVAKVNWPAGVEVTQIVPPIEENMRVGGEICRFTFDSPTSADDHVLEPSFGIGLLGAGAVQRADLVLGQFIEYVDHLGDAVLSGAEVRGAFIGVGENSRP